MKYFKNYNEAYQNCDIISKTEDKFTQETIVKTNQILLDLKAFGIESISVDYGYARYFDGDYKPRLFSSTGLAVYDSLIVPRSCTHWGIQYISSQKGEEFSIVLRKSGFENVIIININGHTNIRLEKNGYVSDEFPIAKEDFIKCCEAKTLSFQVREGDRVSYERDCDDFILFCQAMYNEVINGGKYQEASKILKSRCQKELEEFKAWTDQKNLEEEKKRDKERESETSDWIIVIIVGLIVSFLMIGLPLILCW